MSKETSLQLAIVGGIGNIYLSYDGQIVHIFYAKNLDILTVTKLPNKKDVGYFGVSKNFNINELLWVKEYLILVSKMVMDGGPKDDSIPSWDFIQRRYFIRNALCFIDSLIDEKKVSTSMAITKLCQGPIVDGLNVEEETALGQKLYKT